MRIYMMTDLEGISGVVGIEYMDRATPYYASARELLTADVNAAVAGCFDGGAGEVWVRDGHGGTGNNLITDRLDPRAVLDKDTARWTASLDEGFDATMMIGQHAMAGTLDGFLDHTMSSASWFRYTINGRPLGEIGMWATIAAHFGVPLVYLSGDEAACAEARKLLGGIVTTAVKRGVGRNRAEGLHPRLAGEAIRRDVARCLKRGRFPRPLVWKKPLKCRLTFYRSDMADGAAGRSGTKRIDARTVEKVTDSQLDIRV